MKRIVILCDGTWNRSDRTFPTNVVRLAQAMRTVAPDGTVQVPIYVQGVGSGAGPTDGLRKIDAILGGAFGLGLLQNIEEAYRHLVFLYEPGDEIFVFGFSRGAYTARSLTGFIRSTGILPRGGLSRIPDAMTRYRTMRDPRLHPSTAQSAAFRDEIGSCVATGRSELDWRVVCGKPDRPLLRIAFLGVWDSVGSLGIPRHVPVLGSWTAPKYQFHDASLSSIVRAARHAVALDERRRDFAPTCWDNVAELNGEAGQGDPPPYQEKHFAGDHGSVGGGGDVVALSHIALRWVIAGAERAGLRFDPVRLAEIEAGANPMGPLVNSTQSPSGLFNWITRLRPKDRDGPEDIADVHPSVLERWLDDAGGRRPYRPRSLSRIAAQLEAHRSTRAGATASGAPHPLPGGQAPSGIASTRSSAARSASET